MKYILLVLGTILPILGTAEPNISPENYQKLAVCLFVGDIASSVQQIRHEGDTLAMFESKAPKLLESYHQDSNVINKIMSIGRDVYQIPIEFKRSEVFVIYYNQCINGIELSDEGSYM